MSCNGGGDIYINKNTYSYKWGTLYELSYAVVKMKNWKYQHRFFKTMLIEKKLQNNIYLYIKKT